MNDLQKVIAEMRSYGQVAASPCCVADWADRLEAIAEQEPVAWRILWPYDNLPSESCWIITEDADDIKTARESGMEMIPRYANPVSAKTLSVSDDPCPGCTPNSICRTPNCGRNKTEEMRRRFGGVK
jgi:hypothetical protein